MNSSYDFDQDGFISADDVRLLLNHIPLRKVGNISNSKPLLFGCADGLYSEAEGRANDFENQSINRKEIDSFVDQVFE